MAAHKTTSNTGGRRTAAAASWTFPSALPWLDYPSSLSHSWSSQSDGGGDAENRFLGVETGPDEQPMGDRQLAVDNSDLDDFYLRYYVGHRSGRHGHEFTEFEIYASGKLRYANHSKYKNEPLIRREVQLNAAVVDEFKRIIVESALTDVDDQKWPEPAGEHLGRQELECKVGRHHISYATVQIGSLADIQRSADPEGLTIFYRTTQDLRELVLTLINAHFKERPI